MSFILGLVQGLTEFLPVSSTGHLILVREIFEAEHASQELAFDAMLHLATTAAVILYFSKDIGLLMHAVFRILGRLPVDSRDRNLVGALVLGTIPAVILGLLLENFMEHAFRNPLLVAAVLVLGSMVFAYAEYVHTYKNVRGEITPSLGFKAGLFQSLALIPGMSRSGITIAGGLIMGLTRYEAARLSFLLAIPVMLGAGTKKLFELLEASSRVDWVGITVGSITAFFVGLAAIHFMMNFMRTNSLWPFIWYRILLAAFVVALVFFG